jgi:hypothetical protein
VIKIEVRGLKGSKEAIRHFQKKIIYQKKVTKKIFNIIVESQKLFQSSKNQL